jgi:hypothetical protein
MQRRTSLSRRERKSFFSIAAEAQVGASQNGSQPSARLETHAATALEIGTLRPARRPPRTEFAIPDRRMCIPCAAVVATSVARGVQRM